MTWLFSFLFFLFEHFAFFYAWRECFWYGRTSGLFSHPWGFHDVAWNRGDGAKEEMGFRLWLHKMRGHKTRLVGGNGWEGWQVRQQAVKGRTSTMEGESVKVGMGNLLTYDFVCMDLGLFFLALETSYQGNGSSASSSCCLLLLLLCCSLGTWWKVGGDRARGGRGWCIERARVCVCI